MLPTVLIAESSRFSRTAVDHVRAMAHVELADLDRRGLLERVPNAEILWVRLRHRIDRQVMEAAPRLQAIATATTGLNHIDVVEAQRRNIQIISLRGQTEFLRGVYATAEHTMALIFASMRRLPAACQDVARGGWNRDLFLGRELHGKTAGVVGYGRVGRMVAHYLCAFGMRVLVTDPRESMELAEPGVEFTSFHDLLAASDVVTLHVELSENTRGFFGRHEFGRMKQGSWFINTARGELVDEAALLRTLRSGQIAGAALDVMSNERSQGMNRRPLVEYARLHDNLLITPHIGGWTAESREKTENFLAEQVVAFLRTQTGQVRIETRDWEGVR
jgi:D-3-phosphoglycerate dehydrogenase / 2-oxoglutarate reductase